MNRKLEQAANKHAILSWQIHTNRTAEAVKELSKEERARSKFNAELCEERKRWAVELLSRTQQRMMARLCHGTQLNEKETK